MDQYFGSVASNISVLVLLVASRNFSLNLLVISYNLDCHHLDFPVEHHYIVIFLPVLVYSENCIAQYINIIFRTVSAIRTILYIYICIKIHEISLENLL